MRILNSVGLNVKNRVSSSSYNLIMDYNLLLNYIKLLIID